MLRAALVIGHLGHGGAERQLTELALHARDYGVDAEVFCLGGIEEPFGSRVRSAGIPRAALRLASDVNSS